MSHKDVLKALFPIELGEVFDNKLGLIGIKLDEAAAAVDAMLLEFYPDTTSEMLPDWERVCGLTPGESDTTQTRRDTVLVKIRERASLSIPYFYSVAEKLGYTITIEELMPDTDGLGYEGIFRWRVTINNDTVPRYFRAGESAAGERLLDWDTVDAIEGLFTDIKPAHTEIIYAYA